MDILKKLKEKRDNLIEQEYLLDWVSRHLEYGDKIILFVDNKYYQVRYNSSVSRNGVYYKIIPIRNIDIMAENLTFIIAQKSNLFPSFSVNPNDWNISGEGFFYYLYESKKRFNNKFLPVRFGLTNEEKIASLRLARSALNKFFQNGQTYNRDDMRIWCFEAGCSSFFSNQGSVCVTIWHGGELRGSWPIYDSALGDGIIQAAINAARDSRFKPIEPEEIQNIKIQITFMSDVRMPVTETFLFSNNLFVDRGYYLSKNKNSGLYLPEVFNQVYFSGTYDFFTRLAIEKAKLSCFWDDKKIKTVFFKVVDFIENDDGSSFFDLFGPVIINNVEEASSANIQTAMYDAANWLLELQETDGNFKPIIGALAENRKQVDWPRSAFCGFVLSEMYKFSHDKKYLDASKKNLFFIKKFLNILSPAVQMLSCSYAGLNALNIFEITSEADYYKMAKNFAEQIKKVGHDLIPDPITSQQRASFFLSLSQKDKSYLKDAIDFADFAIKYFDKLYNDKKNINIVNLAEIINICSKMDKLTGEDRHQKKMEQIGNYFLCFEKKQWSEKVCSYSNNHNSDYCYTRGAGKIYEVLALIPALKKNTKRLAAWLIAMQYNESNIFFIPLNLSKKILGGFRHDYYNSDAWIDSAGHFVLGSLRFLKKELKK